LPKDLVLATKVDPLIGSNDFSGDRVRKSVAESLERLGVDRLQLVYLHDPEKISFEVGMAKGGPVEAMVKLRDEGVIEHIGVAGGPINLMFRGSHQPQSIHACGPVGRASNRGCASSQCRLRRRRAVWRRHVGQGSRLGTEILLRAREPSGRGTVDMKGGVACMLMAVETLKEIGVELGGDVVFTSVVDEEIGGMGSLAMVDRGYRADAGIMTEPTALLPCAMASCGDASSSTASAVMRS
jgi:Peptidase family M20/M25/M40/Aldo/keto reductase family